MLQAFGGDKAARRKQWEAKQKPGAATSPTTEQKAIETVEEPDRTGHMLGLTVWCVPATPRRAACVARPVSTPPRVPRPHPPPEMLTREGGVIPCNATREGGANP